MWEKIYGALRRANQIIARILGLGLVLSALFIIVDVVLRKSSFGSLGGSDEISGYVMATLASWGLAFALVERAHVRIDFMRQKLASNQRMLIDLFAMIATNAVVVLIMVKCWPVLEKTLARGSTANTVLETPMWIPQGIWFTGWLWFAFSTTVLSLVGIAYLSRGLSREFDAALGMGSEIDG